MCLNPKYILNPTLKKIRETGEIDLSSISVVKNFRPTTSNIVWHSNGTISEQEYCNYVDLGIYDKSLKGYRVAQYIKCNCGKCSECVEQQVAQLTFRMMLEQEKHSNFAYWLTLTYEDSNLSFIDEYPVLVKSDLQKFFKRLRINMTRKGYDIESLKYFAIGEYGMSKTDNMRPHYHAVIYYDKLPVNIMYDQFIEAWNLGFVTLDTVVPGRIRYVAMAHATANKLFPVNEFQTRPFSLRSKGLGLPTDEQKEQIRNIGAKVGDASLQIDRYLNSKCYTNYELKDKKRFQHVTGSVEDDYLQKFKSYSQKDLDKLTPNEVRQIMSKIESDSQFRENKFYKRYVLKKK